MSRWHGTAKTPAGLVYFVFDDTNQQLISARFDQRDVVGPAHKKSPIHEAFAQYCGGILDSFDEVSVPIAQSEFNVNVYAAMRMISPGTVRTYGELAARSGYPRASRAVGTACGRNELVVVVPCHRVVASKGIGGYNFGVELKTKLLIHEGVEGY
jgi:O-6-methylguanine DNA methyltransferase